MGAHACMTSAVPGSNTTRDIGSSVSLSFQIKNCGNTSGNFHMFIRKNGVICDRRENFALAVNGYSDVLYCEFTMPTLSVIVKYTGGHSEGGTWIEDYEREIIISPAVTICDQSVKVSDKDTGAGIQNVTVAARPTTGTIIRCTTNSWGECTLKNLAENKSYRLVVESYPNDYECQYTSDCEETITACTTERRFRLKRIELTCEQLIRVIDENGSLINASVTVSGATCSLYATGRYRITLTKGDYLTARATKSGYISDSEPFTACIEEITLRIQKSCTCGDWVNRECVDDTHRRQTRTCTPSGCDTEERTIYDASCIPGTCNQPVKVKDKDTGVGIGNVTVAARPTTGAIIRCTTNSVGQCTLVDLVEGDSYGLVVESYPEDYECQYTVDCEQSITACTPDERTFRLKEKILTCEQLVKVVDYATKELIDASVSVSGATCTRYATGKYKITLTKGDYLTAKATKSGYEDATYPFTACIGEITLELKDIPPQPYTINITVNDENGNPIEGVYADIDGCVLTCSEKKCTDSDVVVYEGECRIEEWKGDGYNVVTNSEGKVSIGLPVTEATGRTVDKWRIRVGKSGYLNESLHEDWTGFEEAVGAGTYNFVFTLTFVTVEDKFIVHTIGFKEGDIVQCQRAYGWSKCFIPTPLSLPVFKAPDVFPDGTVEFTTADGLREGETYGIGPRIADAILPTGPAWCGVFKGIREITMPRYAVFGFACSLMGMDPAGDECRRFWEEMIDPVYCANCVTGVLKGEDVHGAEYHPGTFELAMFPVVVVCSFIPWLPGAKITKSLGRLFRKASKYGDNLADVRKYYEDDYLDIYRIQAYGDDVRLENWAKALDEGNVAEARRIQADIIAHHATGITDAKSVDNFNSWLDELEKQIDNIDPKQVDEIADQRARILGAANACMDDVTDFTRVYDEKYIEFIDVARKGSKDTRVATFVRSTDVVCSPTLFCKLSVLNAKDTLKVGRTTLDMLEYTKFIYKHGGHETGHNGFVHALRLLAVSDESDIIALRGYMKADDWVGFSSWTDNVLNKFDSNYVGQIDFFDNERVRILAQWAYERVDDIMGTSGFRDELTCMLGDLVKNVPESKKVVGDANVYPRVVAVNAVTEPDDAARTVVRLMDNAPEVEHNVLFGSMWVSMEKATSLGYLSKGRVSRWTDDLVHAAMEDPQVYAYLKYDRARVIEGVAKGDLSKLDDFVEALKRGDIDGARIKLDDAAKGTPVGSIDRTYGIVRETEEVLDDVSATPYTRAQMHQILDETCENVYLLTAKTPADMKRVVTGVEKASFVQIFQRGARRIIDRTSGGLKKLRRKRPDLDTPEGDLYSTTLRNGKIVSETYKMPPKEVRNFIWRHWKGIGMIGTAAVIMVPWWAVDNAVFLVYMGREGGWIDKLWGNRWLDAYWRIVDASEKMELDPCVKSHQELYVGALEEMKELLQVDPVLPEKAESLVYNYMVQWGFTPSQPSETFKEQCYQQFNSDNERYFQIVQHCPSPVEPSFGFAITEMPEMFPAVTSIIEDADTLYVVPPDELPSGDELYWEHGNPILVRLVGINSPEGDNYYYSCTGKKEPWMVRRLVTPGEECISEERWYVDSIFYAQANAWLAKQLPKDTHVTLRSDIDRQWLTKYKKIRFLGAVYKGTTNIDVEELKAGYAVLFIVEKNKQVWDFANNKLKTEYADAENEAKLKKTLIWDPKWQKPCPATEVEWGYAPSPEVNVETTFTGGVVGCDPSEITDWTWYFDGNYWKEGQIVTHKFTKAEAGSHMIRLDVCAGIISHTRTVSVKDPEAVKNVTISATPPSPVDVGTMVTFVGTAETTAPYVIDTWTWKITDPMGIETTKTGKTIDHLLNKVGTWSVVLTACNNTVPANCSSSTTKKMKVEEYVPPPPDKGDLTIKAFRARDFSEAVSVASFIVDGVDKGGGVAVTVKDILISENPHSIEIMMKAGEYMTCYADIPDECYSPCVFGVNIAKDVTTELRICMAKSILAVSDPSGATVHIKPEGAPTYEEIPSSHMLALGTYRIKFSGLAGYGTLEAVVTVAEDGVVCESVLTLGGVCYTTTRPGLLVSGFLIKAYPEIIPVPGELIREDNSDVTIGPD